MYEAFSDNLLTELETSERKEQPKKCSPSRMRNECSVHIADAAQQSNTVTKKGELLVTRNRSLFVAAALTAEAVQHLRKGLIHKDSVQKGRIEKTSV